MNTQANVTHIESVGRKLQLPVVTRADETFPVDVFIDLPNIAKSLKSLDCLNADYGVLVSIIVREFAGRLGITSDYRVEAVGNASCRPVVVCRAVHCFTSIPINYHPDDVEKVANYQNFLTALRLQHGFRVEEIELDFHGHHICNNNSGDNNIAQENRTWQPHEKGIDVSLAIRLMQRCMSPGRPAGVVIASGDADFKPVLREVTTQCRPIRGTVAAFADALSHVYLAGKHCPWEYPIILDDYISELNKEGDCYEEYNGK